MARPMDLRYISCVIEHLFEVRRRVSSPTMLHDRRGGHRRGRASVVPGFVTASFVVGPTPPASACRCCSNGRFPPGPPTTGRCAPGYASSRRSARAGGAPPSRGPRPGLGARLPVRPDRRRADLEASARRRRVHREALAIECGRRIDSDATVAVLDGLVAQRGAAPEHIRCDNGPELTANALRDWCHFSRAHSAYIEPGSPWQNPYVESFGSRVRDELLAGELFETLSEAQVMVADWREDYNDRRPHSSHGMRSPAGFARTWARAPGGAGSPSAGARRPADRRRTRRRPRSRTETRRGARSGARPPSRCVRPPGSSAGRRCHYAACSNRPPTLVGGGPMRGSVQRRRFVTSLRARLRRSPRQQAGDRYLSSGPMDPRHVSRVEFVAVTSLGRTSRSGRKYRSKLRSKGSR